MNVTRKSAAALIEPGTDDQTSPTGSFHIILSTPDLDRDGESLGAGEWQTPLPAMIPIDMDHGMTVATTVGSGVPSIEADGTLHVRGTYTSLPQGQQMRTLVNEGHITATSVTFLQKTGAAGKTVRELLNGTFTPIPANPNAVVLSSKALAGAEARRVQQIHDHTMAMGAACQAGADGGKSLRRKATAADGHDGLDAAGLAQATDAALDHACDMIAALADPTSLPPDVQEIFALVQAAGASVDDLLTEAGLPDPDDMDDESAAADQDAPDTGSGASKSAAADEELTSQKHRVRQLALGALRDTYTQKGQA